MIIRFVVMFFVSVHCFAVTNITWDDLKQLDVESGQMSDQLRLLNHHPINIEGFIVPLEVDEYADKVIEFFLVPDPLACIHVPPPPPNQMIFVSMNEQISLDMDYRGVAISGTLNVTQADDGSYGYELDGNSAKEANIEYKDSLFDILMFD